MRLGQKTIVWIVFLLSKYQGTFDPNCTYNSWALRFKYVRGRKYTDTVSPVYFIRQFVHGLQDDCCYQSEILTIDSIETDVINKENIYFNMRNYLTQ